MAKKQFEEYFKHINKDITEDIEKFVKNDVFGNSEYLFYKKINGVNRGYCSYCNNEFDVESLKHNEYGTCPICGASVHAKSLRYGRGNCFNAACFYYFEKSIIDPKVITCKGYYVTKDYAVDYKAAETKYELCAVYIFGPDKTTMLRYQYWEDTYYKTESIFDFNIEWLANMMCYCNFKDIGKVIKGTAYQYMPYKKFEGHYSIVKLFQEYKKHPGIEYLVKEGFGNLVEDKLTGKPTYSAVNWNGSTILKILKIDKQDLQQIRAEREEISFMFLKILQDSKKNKWKLSLNEIGEIENKYSVSDYAGLKKAAKYGSIQRIFRYLDKQYTKFNGDKKDRYYYAHHQVLTILKDYIGDCEMLGMDLNDEHVLFPKNLYIAHQNTSKQIKIKKNELFDAMIKKRISKLEVYKFQHGDYLIRPAESTADLINEGSTLNHCVATHYTKPYAKGETIILFVRKTAEPDVPFCTVEVKDNKVKQAYIKNDRVPNKETLDFIDIFKAKKLQPKSKKVEKSA